jgi:hypothetical protein
MNDEIAYSEMINCTNRRDVRNTGKYFRQSRHKWENNVKKRQNAKELRQILRNVDMKVTVAFNGESNFVLRLVPLCLPISRWLPCFWSSFLFYSLLQFPF